VFVSMMGGHTTVVLNPSGRVAGRTADGRMIGHCEDDDATIRSLLLPDDPTRTFEQPRERPNLMAIQRTEWRGGCSRLLKVLLVMNDHMVLVCRKPLAHLSLASPCRGDETKDPSPAVAVLSLFGRNVLRTCTYP
jgi:hypothetical protein